MTTSTVRGRARALALLLATGSLGIGLLAARLLLTGDAATVDGLWESTLLSALCLASLWAAIVALLARRAIDSPPAAAGAGPSRALAGLLLTIAAWSAVTSSASAAPAGATAMNPFGSGATPVATAPAVQPAVQRVVPTVPSVPSPDFAAQPAQEGDQDRDCSPVQTAPEPGWLPPAPRAVAPADASTLVMNCPSRPAAEATPVVVHRGDSLWSIVARALGPDASPGRIAHALPSWHEANRSVIGDDPDLLRPGQILHSPTETTTTQGNS